MSLYLEVRLQDEAGKWSGPVRHDAVNGTFPTAGITVEEGQRAAKDFAHLQRDRRPFVLRIGFSE